jgi:hypothetical protein
MLNEQCKIDKLYPLYVNFFCEFATRLALLYSVTEHLTVARGTAVLGTVGRRNDCPQLLICKLRAPSFIFFCRILNGAFSNQNAYCKN